MSFDPISVIGKPDWLVPQERKYPLYFDFPYLVKKKINIELPDAYELGSLPENFSSSLDEFNYSRNFTKNGNKIEVQEMFALVGTYVNSDKFDQIKKFYSNVHNKLKEKIILKAKVMQ